MASVVAHQPSAMGSSSASKVQRQTSSESGSQQQRKGSADNKRLSPKKREQLAHRYINIVEYEFVPKTLRVQTGFKVSWLKHSGDAEDRHLIRFLGEEEKESEGVEFGFGGTFTRLFTRPGVYEYYCERHVFMRGEIVVEGSAGSTEQPSPSSLAVPVVVSESSKAVLTLPSSSTTKKAPYDAKYQEYASKRQTTREKLAQARNNREVRLDSSESKTTDSPKSGKEDLAAIVEFGVSDDEEEAPKPSQKQTGKGLPAKTQPTRVPSPQLASSSMVKTESSQMLKSEQSPVPQDEAKTTTITSSGCFNAKEAREFMQERWMSHVADQEIKWI